MFAKQKANYAAYQTLEQEKLQNHSKQVLDKFNTQAKKEKEISERTKYQVQNHIEEVAERFEKAEEGKAKH